MHRHIGKKLQNIVEKKQVLTSRKLERNVFIYMHAILGWRRVYLNNDTKIDTIKTELYSI